MPTTVIENEWIPLADGRRLAARVWLPDGQGQFPAILEYLPYRKRDGTAARDETTHSVFSSAGYACIRVDVSGTGESDGLFDDEYSERELSDGEQALSWIAKQEWCDGNVGMIGISWGGFNGLQIAYRQPPELKAVVSVASTVDRYADDIHFMGGCLMTDNMNWGTQLSAFLARPADPELRCDWRENWLARLRNVPLASADWLRHPTRDEQWKHGSVCEDWSRIQAPVLAITGWADAFMNAPPALAANLSVPCKALIGPWEHKYAHLSRLGPADFHGEAIAWFDRWLKGKHNDVEDLPDYRAFMQEHFNPTIAYAPRVGRWIAERDWPSPNVSEETVFLGLGTFEREPVDDVVLVRSPANIGQASGYYCPGMRIDNELPGDQGADDQMSSCFEIRLEEPLELLGRPRLKFAFTVDKPAAQLVARLCDVSPEGVSQRITYRAFNLTHFASHETPELLVPGKVYEAEFALNECAHRLRAGHRLRLALSTSYWPIVWPSPELATVTLLLSRSALQLPVRSVTEEIEPNNPGPAIEYPTLESKQVRPTVGTSERRILGDGTVVLETFDDFGQTENPTHGLVVGSNVHETYSIHPDDPASAKFGAKWRFTFERGDWRVAIHTEQTVACDPKTFHLHRKISAFEGSGEVQVFSRDWSEIVDRTFV